MAFHEGALVCGGDRCAKQNLGYTDFQSHPAGCFSYLIWKKLN